MTSKQCSCGKGYVSAHDGKCGHCRTRADRAALDAKFKESARVDAMFSVANTCHLGEHCRCKAGDSVGCWNEKA